MVGTALEKDLERLQAQLIDLGVMVKRTTIESVEILKTQQIEAARRLIAADSEINRRRYSIESDALVLIAKRQPMARDLRSLAAILRIVSELERIADYSKGIAKISIKLGSKPLIKPPVDIPRMAALASDMLHRSLLSFIDRDVETARSIIAEDCHIDDLYHQMYRELMTYVLSDPSSIDYASHLMWVVHNLERTADRVVNICWRVITTVTGELIQFQDLDDK